MNVVNFGSLNIDYTFQVDEIVRPGQTIDSRHVTCFPGGKGLNQSIAFARTGGEICHAGMIGRDGLFLKELLEKDGVDCACVQVLDDAGTGKAFIQVDQNGQNSIVFSGGANRAITSAQITAVLDRFSAGDWLLLQNEISNVDLLIDQADRRGMRVIFNPSPMSDAVLGYPLDRVWLFLLNEDEGKRLTGQDAPRDILAAMARQYPRAQVILTLGGQGALWSDGKATLFQEAVPVAAVDTTGAGDTFTGYVLACLSRGEDIGSSMRKAAMAAAIAVTRKGAASSIPWMEEI